MPPATRHPRRLGIFLAYDTAGIIDDYVVRLLRDMRPNLADLIIMVNGPLTDAGRAKLREFTDAIHVRPNEGFDYGAWQEGWLRHCGFDRLQTYDELVLFNDSYFGPLHPFAEVFAEMDRRAVDFWGLTVHGAVKGSGLSPYGHRPRYLQTFFLVFSSRLLHAPAFREFWEKQPKYRHVYELADRFGGVMTRHFADLGFTWSACADTTDLEDPGLKNFAHHSYNFEEMIVRRRFPVIKRRTFVSPRWNHLRHNDGSRIPAVLDFVQNQCNYDLGLIYDHFLRKHDIGDFKDWLNLDFVLRSADAQAPALPAGKKIAVAALLLDPAEFPRRLPFLQNAPADVDLWIATDTEEKEQAIVQGLGADLARRCRMVRLSPGARGLAAMLQACGDRLREYDYLGFIHDRLPAGKEFPTVARDALDRLWNNFLPDPGFVRQIVALLESRPRLGLLVPPAPYHGSYFRSEIHDEPAGFSRAVRLAEQLGIRAPLFKDKPALCAEPVFWCRPAALEPLFAAPWKELIPAPGDPAQAGRELERFDRTLARLLPHAAQAGGFLTGYAMTERQAAADLTNLRFMLNHVKLALAGTPGLRFDCFASFRLSLANLRKALNMPGMRAGLRWMDRFRHYAEHRGPAFLTRWFTRYFNHGTARSPKG